MRYVPMVVVLLQAASSWACVDGAPCCGADSQYSCAGNQHQW